MRRIRVRAATGVAVATVMALVAAGCTGGDQQPGAGSVDPNTPVTLTWWHNATTEPLKSVFQQIADDYHTAHPNVTFKVEPIQNEQFTTKVPLALQSSTPPDIFLQWGGGEMAGQVTSGQVADLTGLTKDWIGQIGKAADGWKLDGKQYGVPFVLHSVGFWYRKDLFEQVGVSAPPSTMDELKDAIGKFKAKGITPISIGSKDRWPDAFYWAYFAVRGCSQDTLKQAAALTMNDRCWTKAGQDLKSFLDTQPFQNGFLGTPAQQGAGSSAGMLANGQAAMELQGDWQASTMPSLTEDKQLSSKLGWFPFPSISGGAGNPSATLGGGDGFSCTTKAAAACADFLKYLASAEVQRKLVITGLPVNPEAASALTDPTMKTILEYSQKAPYMQTYFDKALPTAAGLALNDAIANFFAGQGTPEGIVKAATEAATGGR
ncbi:raffinose/stachyose/melibiose transport system substrate-binding protein [Kibdelosporangium banguiense]|uniref:Raffinose/stachyose/melibiose transport system substrate-binding protein n=1 Tax=Kibdelosporangium banguiense TaxID=1365924 RepID=A0ABS4TR31_9PSEU|nr:extracellular solute-binding protein [Kibdelosporangium banguiense]MBP2326866.1 raffinose/stachyose/melibiose transport system substrate-binding protein [Kibdelosporangium banguiense]